ncbi:diaminopimelate decarboxylase [Actinokineospora bangkokensis]|uniref:Diaminopimelate decarboxylase n=1 Tax=Actinokineospora bangkokensis TaxID=1193682 RepID=A0A1Q9LL07_9PSEU|nr:diaminopimelate decarboxylase [Actinokineospora bangkokensis]OLR92737.1 diaminopimelate decarboxylase [Actinokineospora bangkokensis]
MTLAELLPSLGAVEPLTGQCWPRGTHLGPDADLVVDGTGLVGLAARFGTPCHVLSEGHARAAARDFRRALPRAEVLFAGKSAPIRAVYSWMADEGLSLDVCSAGEVEVGRAAGVPGARMVLHGNAKTDDDLKAAVAHGVRRVVVDSASELPALAALCPAGQEVLIRVIPEVDAHTHAAITTGVRGQKFGVPAEDLPAVAAAIARHPNLTLVGLHCHIGSQVTRVAAYETAVRRMVHLLPGPLRDLDLGGGFAAPYHPGEPTFDVQGFATRVQIALQQECAARRLPQPTLLVEPGRSIVANAGITLYRVVSVKPGFAAVDGGMSDNPRPSLYGARYAPRLLGRTTRAHRTPTTVVGRHCESGDIIAENAPLPADLHPGDLLAVPATGAYHTALASNYNMVCRPPVISVHNGHATPRIRRESLSDLMARDLG